MSCLTAGWHLCHFQLNTARLCHHVTRQRCNIRDKLPIAQQSSCRMSPGLVKRVPSRMILFDSVWCCFGLHFGLGSTFVNAPRLWFHFCPPWGPVPFMVAGALGAFSAPGSQAWSLSGPLGCIFDWVPAALGLPCLWLLSSSRSVVPWAYVWPLVVFGSWVAPGRVQVYRHKVTKFLSLIHI